MLVVSNQPRPWIIEFKPSTNPDLVWIRKKIRLLARMASSFNTDL